MSRIQVDSLLKRDGSQFPIGKIGQIINSSTDYNQVTQTTSLTDILSAGGTVWETSITPSVTSSKIFLNGCLCFNSYNTSGTNSEGRSSLFVYYKIGSGSYTQLKDFNEMLGVYDYGGHGIWSPQVVTLSNLITTNTTSAVTVKFQVKCNNGSVQNVFNTGTNDSQVSLMEVLA